MTNAKQTTSGANIQKAGQQNTQFSTEFASETNVAEVKQANAQSEAKKQQSVGQQNAQFGTEFASETNVAEVRQANAQSAAKKQ